MRTTPDHQRPAPRPPIRAVAAAMVFLGVAAPLHAQVLSTPGDAKRPLRSSVETAVALPGGAIIHSSPRAVVNIRAIPFSTHPGDPPPTASPAPTPPATSHAVLMLWDEFEDGRRKPFYAYSLDGRTLAGRVRPHEQLLNLRFPTRQGFDPLRGEPTIDPPYRAGQGSTKLHIVQFHAPPLPEMQAIIRSIAGEEAILRHIPDSAMIVRMDALQRAEVAAHPLVRWCGPFHTAYKLDPVVAADIALATGPLADRELPPLRYSIELFTRGMEAQQRVADRALALGGAVEVVTPDAFRMEISITARQLLEIAHMDEVHTIDPWGGPGGTDMNIVRRTAGAEYLKDALGSSGQGVRAAVFDTELRAMHREFSTFTPLIHSPALSASQEPHGTSVFGHLFARGAVPTARGMLPDAEARIFSGFDGTTPFGGTRTRMSLARELVDPAGPYRAVLETASVGSELTRFYTTVSAEVDDYLHQTRLLSVQSQGNAGPSAVPRESRPQAWAKNIVSVGAVNHRGTLAREDDRWLDGGGASIGPAADGRTKPDLAFFFDSTHAPAGTSDTAYVQFGGTSSAAPSVAGCFGLFFQMWHEGVWAGRGGGSDVFASRAAMTTARAALISSAQRYDWNTEGPNASITRDVQGWGIPDLRSLYQLRHCTVIVDEEDPLTPLGVHRYHIRIEPDEAALNIVMCYVDPFGTTSASLDRINDLSLRVIAPDGAVYWGNHGLTAGNISLPGGSSNTRDTVECIFVEHPRAGLWTVEIHGDVIVQDAHPATEAIDAAYGLWITGGTRAAPVPPAP
jgi:serine protease AprX